MLTGLFLAALSIQVIKGPSFDCTAAMEPVEDAICTSAPLARLDVRMADRYAAVRRALAPEARRALGVDQRWFLGARDEWFENRERWADFPDLAGRMTDRIAFLDSIDTRRSDRLTGRWRNVAGVVEITAAGAGRARVEVNAARPVNARWLCDVSFSGAVSGGAVQGLAESDRSYRLSATLKDGVLHVEETAMRGAAAGPGYCGHNGSVAGTYFRVR